MTTSCEEPTRNTFAFCIRSSRFKPTNRVVCSGRWVFDITQFKPFGAPVLSFIGMEGEPSYLNVDVKKVFAPSREALTLREKQVLAAMMAGNQSKEIASLLNISKQTVDNTGKIC